MSRITGFRRSVVVDEHTCKACLAANGSIVADVNELMNVCEYRSDDSDFVLSGMRCRCTAVPVCEVNHD